MGLPHGVRGIDHSLLKFNLLYVALPRGPSRRGRH
jgi:hypothetical protein